MTCFYFPLASDRSTNIHCQIMDLFKRKESFKENLIQIITEKRNDLRVTSTFQDYHQDF